MTNPAGGKDSKGRGWIVAIATFRVVKAVLLVLFSVGAFALINKNVPDVGERVVEWLNIDRGGAIVTDALSRLPLVTDRMLAALGGGAIAYAILFSVEAYGLFRGRVWAEWLTIVATTSFIPFEIYEIVKGATPIKIAAVTVNVAIVIYLVVRRIHEHRKGGEKGGESRGSRELPAPFPAH